MRTIQTCITCLAIALAAHGCSPREPAQAIAQDVKKSPPPAATRIAVSKDSIHAQTEQAVIARTNKPVSVTIDTAMFAGGCFWSMERPFQHVPGVIGTTVGYAGGHLDSPTYEQVNTGTTGHTETVQVEFDRSRVGYEQLLDIYWHNIDPLTQDRQFCDGGADYRTVVFTRSPEQHAAAAKSKAELEQSHRFKSAIVTEIVAGARFWRAEEYHQHFADRNPARYEAYRRGCGRDARLRELWGGSAAPYVPRS